MQDDKLKMKRWKAKKWVVAVVVVTVLLAAFDLSPFGGNVRFYANWISCGQKPVASDTSIGLGAQVLHYIEPVAFQPFRLGQPTYFCTPVEAEQAGYSASPTQYEFPNLQRGA